MTQHLQKQICSTLLCSIYYLNYFAKMLSVPQSYMESNSASNWYSFQCNLLCRIQTGVEFCWVTQHLQKQICSTLLCTIYCLNYFAKMLSGPQSYMESNSASIDIHSNANRIQTGVEFCEWLNKSKADFSTLLCTIYCHKQCRAEQICFWRLSHSTKFSEFCTANCIGMNINRSTITFHVGLWDAQHLSKVVYTIDCA